MPRYAVERRRGNPMTTTYTTKTAVAAVLAAAAIMTPSAGAMPIDQGLAAGPNVPAGVNAGLGPNGGAEAPPAAVVQTAPTRSSSGFDWSDAGVGAAGMLAVIGLGAGGVAVARRGQRRDAMAG